MAKKQRGLKRRINRLDKEHERLWNLFERWEEARPDLPVAQSPYSTGLVKELIRTWEELTMLSPEYWDEKYMKFLQGLLDEEPDNDDSPTSDDSAPPDDDSEGRVLYVD